MRNSLQKWKPRRSNQERGSEVNEIDVIIRIRGSREEVEVNIKNLNKSYIPPQTYGGLSWDFIPESLEDCLRHAQGVWESEETPERRNITRKESRRNLPGGWYPTPKENGD